MQLNAFVVFQFIHIICGTRFTYRPSINKLTDPASILIEQIHDGMGAFVVVSETTNYPFSSKQLIVLLKSVVARAFIQHHLFIQLTSPPRMLSDYTPNHFFLLSYQPALALVATGPSDLAGHRSCERKISRHHPGSKNPYMSLPHGTGHYVHPDATGVRSANVQTKIGASSHPLP
jgi:hypothetical protein